MESNKPLGCGKTEGLDWSESLREGLAESDNLRLRLSVTDFGAEESPETVSDAPIGAARFEEDAMVARRKRKVIRIPISIG